MIPVSWSSTWLMVAMVPSFINALITSAALTDMRWASSPTVMVSGTATSRTSGSVGWANVVCSPLGAERCRPPPRECQPPTPPPESPRVLIWRRRTESSRSTVVGFTFFGFLSVLASVAGFGACSVVGVAAEGAAAAASAAAFCCSASLRSRSCFSRSSAACSSASCSWRRASSCRSSISFASTVGAGGGGGGGASAATACAATSAGSRFTNTRFLRTSTCTVRYLPVASVFLISLVCLRVRVILFFCSAEPCALRRYSSRRDLSCSVRESSGTFLSTPAARSCSSSTDGGTFSSLANWATLVWATLRGLLAVEPMRPRGHDQLLGLFFIQLGQFGKLIDGQISQIIPGLDAALGELGGELRIHAFELEELRVDALDLLLVGDRRDEQRVARAVAKLVHRALVEGLDLIELVDRHVGDLFQC